MAVTMNARWDDSGTVIPGGDAEYVVAEQPIAEYDNWFNYNIVADIQAVIDDVINKFNANTILKADTDNTPAALVVAEQTMVGRKTGNSIAALTDAEVLAIIGVEAGATADQTNTEIRDAVEAATDSNTFTDADHTKLNGIEALATPDQSDAEIRAAVEAATDSNVFTDADHTKLDGIDATNDLRPSMRYVAVSDSEIHGNATQRTIGDNITVYTKLKETDLNDMALSNTTLRIRYTHVGGSASATSAIYKNGTIVSGTEHSRASGNETFTHDVAGCNNDDLIQIYFKRNVSGTWICGVSNLLILGTVTQDAPLSTLGY